MSICNDSSIGWSAGVGYLKGDLPDGLPEALPALQTLIIQSSGLSGTIPEAWFAPGIWEDLDRLNLYNNSALSGPTQPHPMGACML